MVPPKSFRHKKQSGVKPLKSQQDMEIVVSRADWDTFRCNNSNGLVIFANGSSLQWKLSFHRKRIESTSLIHQQNLILKQMDEEMLIS